MSPNLLEVLEAEREIRRVLHCYCRSMDRIDAELGYSVWHEDGLVDYGPIFSGTGRAFIDWVCDYHRTLDAQFHQISNILIDVQNEHAGSETYVTSTHLFRQSGRQILRTIRGRYVDSWSRRSGRWAIDKRLYLHNFDFAQDVVAEMGWGSRDRTDPSNEILGPAKIA
jgi:hypothetical protein